MKKEETITREEAGKMFKQMAACIRQGVLNELNVLYGRLFDEAPTENEFEPIWIMAGQNISDIINHLDDTIEDIEAGHYLPKKKEVTA